MIQQDNITAPDAPLPAPPDPVFASIAFSDGERKSLFVNGEPQPGVIYGLLCTAVAPEAGVHGIQRADFILIAMGRTVQQPGSGLIVPTGGAR